MTKQQSSKPLITEDWLAVILGFILILLVWMGLLGGLIPVPW